MHGKRVRAPDATLFPVAKITGPSVAPSPATQRPCLNITEGGSDRVSERERESFGATNSVSLTQRSSITGFRHFSASKECLIHIDAQFFLPRVTGLGRAQLRAEDRAVRDRLLRRLRAALRLHPLGDRHEEREQRLQLLFKLAGTDRAASTFWLSMFAVPVY